MSESAHPIIDIDPVDHGSERVRAADASQPQEAGASQQQAAGASPAQASDRYYTFTDPEHGDASWRPGSYAGVPRIPRPCAGSPRSASEGAAPAPAYVKAEVIGDKEAGTSASKGRLGGVAQLVAGGAIAAVGVPMLILPGPGLLAIGGGLALAAHGAKRAFGRK